MAKKDDTSPVTKGDLQKQHIALKADINAVERVLRKEIQAQGANLPKEMKEQGAEIRKEMKEQGKVMQDQIETLASLMQAEAEETRRHFDVVVEDSWFKLLGAKHDEVELLKDKTKRHDKDIREIRLHTGMLIVH